MNIPIHTLSRIHRNDDGFVGILGKCEIVLENDWLIQVRSAPLKGNPPLENLPNSCRYLQESSGTTLRLKVTVQWSAENLFPITESFEMDWGGWSKWSINCVAIVPDLILTVMGGSATGEPPGETSQTIY